MKASKAVQQISSQEECDVWLDTVQLKGKAKKKCPARPISKLLNPFAGGSGYNLAVALNFTQTKMEMPKTKQSSISTFFTPHRRVLNKISVSEVPDIDPSLSSCTSTTSTTVASGRKRGREIYSEPAVDHEWENENMTEMEETLLQKQAASRSPSQNMSCEPEEEKSEEWKQPQSKRRITDASSWPGESEPLLQAWSQDPLFTYSQDSEGEFNPTSQEYTAAKDVTSSEPSFLNSLQTEVDFENLVEGRTSTQKCFKQLHSSQMDDEKENSRSLSSNSPMKRSSSSHPGPLSNHKWTEPKVASPRKHTSQLWKKAAKEESLDSQVRWTKPSSSPLKKRAAPARSREVDEDSLATLFTQDSEGFRVMAHRGLQTRSPLKDQSNVSTGIVRTSAYKSLVEEEEDDDMLFTQDSQGNVVIKH